MEEGGGKLNESPQPTFASLPNSFQYSPSLNCLISISEGSGIEILDIHSGQITTRSVVPKDEGQETAPYGICKFLEDEEKLVVSSGCKIGCRSTNGEQIFLSTILQVSEVPGNGQVTVELDIVKAGLLLNGLERCLKTTDPFTTTPGSNSLSNKSKCQQVTLSLKAAYEKAVSKMKDVSGQSIKWLNVCFTMDHNILMSVFNTALLLCKQDKRGPALPVIGDILQRLTSMQKSTFESVCSEKRLMFNEVDRLQTFNSWPHMNYKWALPGPMAEAGFYHPHSSTKSAEDRAMCFTCSVCLVCWESSDQPWSEHKRHASICPFVKGEHTENVPLSAYMATAGAQKLSRNNDKIVCMSNTSCDTLLAVGTEEGYIVIWETFPSLKIHSEYQISVSAIKDPLSKTKKRETLEGIENRLPDTLKVIAAEKANGSLNSTNSLESTLTANETQELTFTSSNGIIPVPLNSPTNYVFKSHSGETKMTDVEFDGESYCVIVNPADGVKETINIGMTEPLIPNGFVSDMNLQQLEGGEQDMILDQSDENDNDVHRNEADFLKSPESITTANNNNINTPKTPKVKSKNVERSCRITSVTIMKDEKTCDKFIIAGVKIEARKSRKNKEKLKCKLSLLVYKLAGKVKVKNESADANLSGFVSPYINNPFAPMSGQTYEDDFSVGSDDDYSIYDDVAMDQSQLAVIDEYLLASQKNQSHPHPSNGGTQNIALSGNEIKTGFDQEEIVKIEDMKTVYEDCTFHKFDIDRTFYTKDMYISDLLVVDGFLVTIIKQDHVKRTTTGVEEKSDKLPNNDFLLVSSITSTKKNVINFKLIAQRQFDSNSLIKDLTIVPCRNLPSNLLTNFTALHQFENTEKNSPYSNLMPKSLVLLGLSDNSLMFLSVPQLIELKMPSNLPEGRSIHKLTYCSTLSSVAICDNLGHLRVCPCLTNQDQPFEMTLDETSNMSVSQWNSRFSQTELKLLSNLIKFEPVTQGCYIFFPVNWYVTRTGGNKASQASPVPNHMLRLSPVEMDKRLMKRTEQLDIELSKADFTFRMFVLVQTSVGYFDILVNLKTPLKENDDFSCSFYIDESRKVNSQGSDTSDAVNNERLICGPILFSSVVMDNKLSGQFTIIVPELINKKSLYVIVKLERCVPPKDTTTATEESLKVNATPPSDFLMANILKDVYVGVYQFNRLVSNSFYFPGCRNTIISDEKFQENLVDQYLELVESNGDIRHGYEIKMILELIVWITSVHVYSTLKDNVPLVSIIYKRLPKFIKASLIYGDRSMCHACCQILLGLKRCSTDKAYSKLLEKELWDLLPHIHQAASSAAYHWAFLLLCDVIGSYYDDVELLNKFTKMLTDVGYAYGQSFTETQKVLDARYGLSDMVFEPYMIEPLCLTMKCGSTFSPNSNKVFDMIRISSDHVPGILEAQPLHFVCMSASEGSKVEVLRPKMATLKNNKGGSQSASGTIPIIPLQMGSESVSENINQSINNLKGEFQKMKEVWNSVAPPVEVVGETFISESVNDKAIKLFDSANQADAIGTMSCPSKKDNGAEKSAAINPSEELNLPDETVIPKQMCMVIDKMHVCSVHYVVLDFQTPVLLTDLIFPPLKALGSITISVWESGQNPEEAQIITHSDRIGNKALVFSNMVTPIQFQYMKILFVGAESCSCVIPLGQFYGSVIQDVTSPNHNADLYEKEYESISCRYALTAERIKPFPIRIDGPSKYSSGFNVMLSTVKRDYLMCVHLQLCLNFLRNNPAWTCVNNLLITKKLDSDLSGLLKLTEKSFSSQRLLLSCLLHSIVYFISARNKNVEGGKSSCLSSNMLSKEEFLSLFKKLCIYGASTITELGTSVLFMLCGKAPWWSDALVDIFQYCFCEDSILPLPRRRLFDVVMKLIHSTEDINQVVEKFLELLQTHIKSMLHKEQSEPNLTTITMFDYILLLLNQILECKDNTMWNFFTPWEHLPEVSSSGNSSTVPNLSFGNNQPSGLNKWFQQVSGNTVAEKMNNLQKAMLVDGAGPKKLSGMKVIKVWYPPKVLKNNSTSASSSVRVSAETPPADKVKAETVVTETESNGLDIEQKVFILKENVIASLKCLMEFIIFKLDIGNPEQLILACKVCSLIVFNSKDLVYLQDILSSEQLKKLFHVCVTHGNNQWLVRTINLLFKSFINQKSLPVESGTPNEDLLNEQMNEMNVKSKTETKSPLSSKKTEQEVITSKVEQFNKMYYESMKNKFYEVTEGVKSSPSTGRSNQGIAMKKELEALLTAHDCKVLHPVRKDFNRILESTLLGIQKQIRKRRPVLRSNNNQKQTLCITEIDEFIEDLNCMYSSSLSYLMNILLDMIKNGSVSCELPLMHELLYLMNLTTSCEAKLDSKIFSYLSDTIIFIFKSPKFSNDTYYSIKKQMINFILQSNCTESLEAQFNLLRLYESDSNDNRSVQKSSLMLFKNLTTRDNLSDTERVLVKKLLVKQITSQNNSIENTDLTQILKGIEKSGLFLLFSSNDEVKASYEIADTITLKVKSFIEDSVVLLQSCQHERSDSKRTVFTLHNGKVRLTGKCHQIENDVAECMHLLSLLKRIFGSNVLHDISRENLLNIITKLIQSLCMCSKLVTESELTKSASLLMSVPGISQSSAIHPLSAAINSVLMEINAGEFWELLVTGLVDVLKTEKLTELCGSTTDGFKVFLLSLLRSSENVWSSWVKKGGFEAICTSIIENCTSNVCWTDSLNHSTVIQDLYSTSIAASSQKLLDRDRVVKDHNGIVMENFAPYAKIYGPPSSAGADVLLVNKSPLRRSRFAAWAHQFQHTDDPWIELTIVLPFEVMLREVIIYMHGNYLIGAPSQVILESKGLSDTFNTLSPVLQTGGLGSIVFHFAEAQICKELRFKLRRPYDGDHIKLNLIELFGSTIFDVTENESIIPVRRKLMVERWIDVLLQLMEDIPLVLTEFCNYHDFQNLLSALITNIPYVCSLCLHRLSSLFITKLLPSYDDFAYKVTEEITTRMLSNFYLNHFNSLQLQLIVQLLSDLITRSEIDQRVRIIKYLLHWFCDLLVLMEDNKRSTVNDVIRLIVTKIFVLVKDMDKSHFKLEPKLRSTMEELLLKRDTNQSSLTHLGKFLALMISIDPEIFTTYFEVANHRLENCHDNESQTQTMGALIAVVACYDSEIDDIRVKCTEFLGRLSDLLCSEIDKIERLNNIANNNESLSTICWVVSIFSYFFMCEFNISSWFTRESGRKFWEPLIRFVCKYDSIKTKCLLIFTLQSMVISVFREILYMTPQNQEYFCKLIIKLLTDGDVNGLNGYMKLLLLQLVIAEDTITVHFRSRSDSYILQNTHGIHLRITTSLNEIEQTLLAIRSEMLGTNSKGKIDKLENATSVADSMPGADLMPDSDLADYVLQTGSSSAAKRKPKAKPDASSSQKTKDNALVNLSIEFYLPELSDSPLDKKLKFGQILQLLYEKSPDLLNSPPLLLYSLTNKNLKKPNETLPNESFLQVPPLCTMLGNFAKQGGLPLLTSHMENEECSGESSYIVLFSLIMPLPGFPRVFLQDRIKAELLLRLMLGVKETKSGQLIQSLIIAQDLPVLPLKSFLYLLQETTSSCEEGLELRRLAFERKVIDFIMHNLRQLSHHEDSKEPKISSMGTPSTSTVPSSNDVNYWAKGTGFGTGSTVSSWDIEKAMKAKKKEEEQIVVVFQVLAAFVDVKDQTSCDTESSLSDRFDELMELLQSLFSNSCVIEVLAGYLRNDSVLDMSRHIPLYHAILALLRALASTKSMLPLLISMRGHSYDLSGKSNNLGKLLTKLRACVETYQSRLKLSCKTKANKSESRPKDYHLKNRLKISKDDEKETKSNEMSESDIIELNLLLADIHSTADYVLLKVEQYEQTLNSTSAFKNALAEETEKAKENEIVAASNNDESEEDKYFNEMISLQFDTYEIVTEKDDNTLQFNVPYHYANSVRSAVKNADATNASRARRLAQEVASLSTSLPISYSSTVFLQCDEERLDVMKVLITGPDDTPYENGCFEFDIYFPPDYPSSPMCVNLQTTGKHTIRFNPNLYNDGKVCLSILNTWHGRPEERWNAQTSNLLQVLVSIQSLILVSDPYFNEPGYERLRGTPQGKQNSNDYNANIEQATVKWAMLEQIKRPSACFKDVIHRHFLMKKNRVIAQCERWIREMKEQAGKRKSTSHSYESLKTHFAELKLELDELEKNEKRRLAKEMSSEKDEGDDIREDVTSEQLCSELKPSEPANSSLIDNVLIEDDGDTYSITNVVYL